MARYAIWNKTDNIITPIGEVLTPEQWIERYPVAQYVPIVCGGGVVNGGIFAVVEDFVAMYEQQGCDFSECVTDQDKLDAIEAFEDARAAIAPDPMPEERIAAALEAQVMMSMMDIEE